MVSRLPLRAFIAVVVCAAAALAAHAADDPGLLRSALMRDRAPPEAALYMTEDGKRAFVLDRTVEPPLLRFVGSREVFVLSSVAAPRGDVVLRIDTGEAVVRAPAVGDVTLYPPDNKLGVPASRTGVADPIAPLEASYGDVAATGLSSDYSDMRVAPLSADLRGQPVVEDALLNAAAAFREAPTRAGSISWVRVEVGEPPGAKVSDEDLVVTVSPKRGYQGRPSSRAIETALGGPEG